MISARWDGVRRCRRRFGATGSGAADKQGLRWRDTVVMFRNERSEEYPRFSKRVIESYQQTGIERGMETANLVYGLDPDFTELYMQYTRGGMYAREVVPQATREICACAALAAIDKQAQLRDHLICGQIHGATKEELLEA